MIISPRQKAAVLLLALAGMLFLNATAAAAPEKEPPLEAKSAVLMETETEAVLYSRDMDKPLPPASITKNMTMLLALEAIEKGELERKETVTVSQNAWEIGGSQMFLEIDQEVTVDELLLGIAVISANDACVALAEHLCETEEAFVERMNERASELDLKNTHFQNSSGLPDPDHYMSAIDIAHLSRHLITTFPESLDMLSRESFTFNQITQYNRNPLLDRYPGADGLKTGFTSDAGYCLDATAEQEGMRLIGVVLNTPSVTARLQDMEALLDYGFQHFQLQKVHEAGETVGSAPVEQGRALEVPLVALEDIKALVPVEEEADIAKTVSLPEPLAAPLEKNSPVGQLKMEVDGEYAGAGDLTPGKSVEKANLLVQAYRSIIGGTVHLGQEIFELLRSLLP